MDILHSMLKWLDYNRGLVAALVLGVIASAWLVGCDVKTGSILDPTRQVTPSQLDREITTLQGQMDKRASAIKTMEAEYNADVTAANQNIVAANADLDAQEAIGSVVQLLTLLATGGLVIDNRRKDRRIAATAATASATAQ